MDNANLELRPYWFALGKFIQRYSLVEAQMNRVLRVFAGTNKNASDAIFSGTRVRDSMNLIRRIAEAQGNELDPLLAKAFPKLGEITTVRDKILHFGLTVEGQAATVSDLARNMPTKAITFSVSVSDLDKLEDDTITVLACLNLWHLEKQWAHLGPERLSRSHQLSERPWRYTMPPLDRRRP